MATGGAAQRSYHSHSANSVLKPKIAPVYGYSSKTPKGCISKTKQLALLIHKGGLEGDQGTTHFQNVRTDIQERIKALQKELYDDAN